MAKKTIMTLAAVLVLALSAGGWAYYYFTARLIRQASAEEIMDHIRGLKAPLVLLNLWASWCEPCKREFPHLLKIQETYAPHGLRVVFVSVDNPKDLDEAIRFMESHKVTTPSFYKGKQSLNFFTKIYPRWKGAVPTSLLFGPDLTLVDAWDGDTTYEEFETRVRKHLDVKEQ